MKNFLVGICFIVIGTILAFVLKDVTTHPAWIVLPLAIITIGGGFQIRAFWVLKKKMDETERQIKGRIGL